MSSLSAEVVFDFERLVEELLKTKPNENEIKRLMEKLSLQYSREPIQRIGYVLEAMNALMTRRREQKEEHDLR